MRPINHVVDASNYVMLELGQPNHTYDLDRLAADAAGAPLRVRWARDGETLDDARRRRAHAHRRRRRDRRRRRHGRSASPGSWAARRPRSPTPPPRSLLELAWWDPMTIARTSKRLNLRSEASARFERGTDPEIVELAARRFAELLAPSGRPAGAGTRSTSGATGRRRSRFAVRTDRVNAVLGTELTAPQITRPAATDRLPCRARGPRRRLRAGRHASPASGPTPAPRST